MSLIINALNADLSLTQIKLKTGPWVKADLNDVPKNGMKVLSTFSCGGGSSFGYKLAGFDVIGCVEIDPEMYQIYKANHHFKHGFNMSIQKFNEIPLEELPEELLNLDVLDGSPPCSSFSMAGSREKKWGSEHHFREGQAKQHLDDLFFNFIETAKRLQPKVVVAENVKGLIQGNARGYVKEIFAGFKDAGYHCQLFLLNAAAMGVPQRRERTFFIANRLGKKISLSFNEEQIPFKQVFNGKTVSKTRSKKRFGDVLIDQNRPISTIATLQRFFVTDTKMMDDSNIYRFQTFPEDYECKNPRYVCGMSVPPFMMQRISNQIYEQLLK